jgi:hypothetical protein
MQVSIPQATTGLVHSGYRRTLLSTLLLATVEVIQFAECTCRDRKLQKKKKKKKKPAVTGKRKNFKETIVECFN